jgi:predicted pyridoxine 5'-phosphate oxidase superfamily flavin-nucleotide-binding protein
MGAVHERITPAIAEFITAQPVFFVASAPSDDDGRVNLSPKGLDTLAVLGEDRVAYLDLTGSGAETIAHLRENGRITIMFCAFEGKPNIVRLYGRGEAIPIDDPRAAPFLDRFPAYPGARSVIVVDVDRVSTSCGYAVPRMQLIDDREQLLEWAERRGPDGLVAYRAEKNAVSIDGLPALP